MFCTVAEVRAAVNFPSSGAPVSDDDITEFILDSEEEIENIYHTHFGNVEISSVATSGSSTTIVDSTQTYTASEYIDYVVWVYAGTNEGEYRPITSNDTTTLTVSPAFSSAIDNTSYFRITKLGYKSEIIDGSGIKYQFVKYQPLIKLNLLEIDSTTITPSNVYQYDSGRLELSSDAETTVFTDTYPQLIDMDYIYGIYPIPRIIKRLCIVLAALRTLTAQIAGTYNDFTSVSLPGGFTGSKGEPYTNIQSSLNYLQGEARGIIYGTQSQGQISGDFRTQASYIPFTLFG